MEHSYTRDYNPNGKKPDGKDDDEIMATRTILVERPPLCPSCHLLPPNHDEKVETPETFSIPIPAYNDEVGRKTINATEEMIQNVHNRNSDTDDWTENLPKYNWTGESLFFRISLSSSMNGFIQRRKNY